MRKILALSSIRSDYDLLSGVYALLAADPDIDFRVLVSGAHLSPNYGMTVANIRADGLPILAEIESLIDSDSRASRLKTASVMLQGAIDIVARWAPDLIVYAGDREDVMVGGLLGAYLGIPTVHFFGGDHEKDGHPDTVIRHAASKLSSAHVVPIAEHRDRLIALGEAPARIFVAGSVALDKFIAHRSVSPEKLAEMFPPGKRLGGYAMVIFHPVDAEMESAGTYFQNILESLASFGIPVCGSYPNTDPGNRSIIDLIERYAGREDFWFYKNLDRDAFLSLYKNARFLIGNSSSGILEAASVPLAAINVGLRQRGRMAGDNVTFCNADRASIDAAVRRVLSDDFRSMLANVTNPYGAGDACRRVADYLINTDFASLRAKIEDPLELARARMTE